MNEHNEPWEVKGLGIIRHIVCNGQIHLASFVDYEDAERAVLCVNACEGLDDELLQGLLDYPDGVTRIKGHIDALTSDLADAEKHVLAARELASEMFRAMPMDTKKDVYLKMTGFLDQTQKIYEDNEKKAGS